AEASPLAREGNHAVVPARVAMDAHKAVRRNAAFEKRPELPFDKLRNRPLPLLLTRKERLEMAVNDGVQHSVLRISRDVAKARILHAQRRSATGGPIVDPLLVSSITAASGGNRGGLRRMHAVFATFR